MDTMKGTEIASFDREPTLQDLIDVIEHYENRTDSETAAGVMFEFKEVSMRDSSSTTYELIDESE